MFVAERFLSDLIQIDRKHPVSTDGGTWYPQACQFLKLEHHIHSSLEKSLIERTMQYIKDRTEGFDDYFPCRKQNCNLEHVKQWLKLFAYIIIIIKVSGLNFTEPNSLFLFYNQLMLMGYPELHRLMFCLILFAYFRLFSVGNFCVIAHLS